MACLAPLHDLRVWSRNLPGPYNRHRRQEETVVKSVECEMKQSVFMIHF